MDPRLQASLLRFAKGLLAGALGSAVLAVQALGPATALQDWRLVAFAAANGFFTGAILAAEKALTWQPTQ